MNHPPSVLPGQTIGILGGGQLGRMLALVALRLGYRVHVFTSEPDSPASHAAHQTFVAPYEDRDAVRHFAKSVDVITLEFENIDLLAIREAESWTPVRPGYRILEIAQHRYREKSYLAEHGFPVTPFALIQDPSDLSHAAQQLGWPMIWKTLQWGYDGKGQSRLEQPSDLHSAIHSLGPAPWIAESVIDLHAEVSILVARNANRDMAVYPMFVNSHRHHILDCSFIPAPPNLHSIENQAKQIALAVADALDLVGLLCIEFFIDSNSHLMINEIAPRPHNSGHLTIEACATSQFEQQLRAVCNLPLGSVEMLHPAAMVNLLGDRWHAGTPRWDLALQHPHAWLHLYGKQDPKPGRKMGHITLLADSAEQATQQALALRSAISPSPNHDTHSPIL